jgi:hypothetical protein
VPGTVGKRESIINYEVDKTVRVVRGSTGMVKRISAAVVLNHQTSTDDKGKVTTAAMSDADRKDDGAGARDHRFQQGPRRLGEPDEHAVHDSRSPPSLSCRCGSSPRCWIWRAAWPGRLGTLLLGALVLMGLVRPALKAMAEGPGGTPWTPAATQIDALVADEPERPPLTGPIGRQCRTGAASPDPGEISARRSAQIDPRQSGGSCQHCQGPGSTARLRPDRHWWALNGKHTMAETDGLEDAAILLMSLGEAEAAEVFKHLSPKEVQKLGEAIAKTKTITRERVDERGGQIHRVAAAQSLLVSNSGDYVRSVLKRALGDDKAALLIDRILQGGDVSGIESLKWMDPFSVAELLRNEHPQIVAAIHGAPGLRPGGRHSEVVQSASATR